MTAQRALFLDRDGVINRHHAQGFVATRQDWQWYPSVASIARAIKAARQTGAKVFVVTNQGGVGAGLYGEVQMLALHTWMRQQLAQHNADIDDLRYSLYHPDASDPRFSNKPEWRKPHPGMLLDLAVQYKVALGPSLMIGDKPSDQAAAANAGCQFKFRGQGDLLEDIQFWL